jgi:hypothetical protein
VLDQIVQRVNKRLGTQLKTLKLLAPGLALLIEGIQASGVLDVEGETPFSFEEEAKKAAEQLKGQAAALQQQVMSQTGTASTNVAAAISEPAAIAAAQQAATFGKSAADGIWKMVAILTRIENNRGGGFIAGTE